LQNSNRRAIEFLYDLPVKLQSKQRANAHFLRRIACEALRAAQNAEEMYRRAFKPLLFSLDPERAHETVAAIAGHVRTLPLADVVLERIFAYESPRLRTQVAGLHLPNPVGLAAGFDKTGELYAFLARLGFGFIESGTFTALAQPGNPRPRLFRYPGAGALVNRMGFNNPGSERAAATLASAPRPIPLGANIGKSKVTPIEEALEDYLLSLDRLYRLADYVAVNVSSPNTPGLRSLQGREALRALLEPLVGRMQALHDEAVRGSARAGRDGIAPPRRPLFVKLAPDLTEREFDESLDAIGASGAAGVIISNTTIDKSAVPAAKDEIGGLSGKPLRERSTELIRRAHARVGGELALIGAGGIFGAEDALAKIQAGASAVQIYTGFVYEGPGLPAQINRGIDAFLERENTTLAELRGSETRSAKAH